MSSPHVPAAIATRARSIKPGAIIELFTADVSMIMSKFTGLPGPTFAFHNSNTQGAAIIPFQGVEYQPFPLQAKGFETTSQGQFPRPTITFSNIGSAMSMLLREYKELNGVKVTRRVTLREYLDDQPGADPTQEMLPHVYYVDRKIAESKRFVTLELTSNLDVEGVQLPRGQLTANACRFHYRSGDGCPYAGPPMTDEHGTLFSVLLPGVVLVDRGAYNPASIYNRGDYAYRLLNGVREYSVCSVNGTQANPPDPAGLITDATHWIRDVCIKTLAADRLRFPTGSLPFGAFPAIIRAPIR